MRGLPQKYISPWSSVSACAGACVFTSPAALLVSTIRSSACERPAPKVYVTMVQRLRLCKCLCVYQPSSTEELCHMRAARVGTSIQAV